MLQGISFPQFMKHFVDFNNEQDRTTKVEVVFFQWSSFLYHKHVDFFFKSRIVHTSTSHYLIQQNLTS